ncbi:MAG: NAD synthetase [Crocosphaera sp.]|nr:NAD synthetase [Crocosphaera sp.]
MEPNTLLDWILTGFALAIFMAAMVMLLGGVSKMNKK